MTIFCGECGATWQCEHAGGGGDAPWVIVISTGHRLCSLGDAILAEPSDGTGSLPRGVYYQQRIEADQQNDRIYAMSGGHNARQGPWWRTHEPTDWPRPGWREQAAIGVK